MDFADRMLDFAVEAQIAQAVPPADIAVQAATVGIPELAEQVENGTISGLDGLARMITVLGLEQESK